MRRRVGSMLRDRPLEALWAAFGVLVAGRALDGLWHARHDEFEGAAEQLEAHWLAWLGTALLLVAALGAMSGVERRRGFLTTVGGCVLYGVVGIWHFIAHANGNDPAVAHVLLVIAQVVMVAGVVVATLDARALRRARA